MKLGKLMWVAGGLTVLGFVVILIFAVLSATLTVALNAVPGLGWVDHWMIPAALMFLWPVLPDRFKALHRPYAIRGSVEIDAPAAVVWNRVLPRPGHGHFSSGVQRVDPIEGQPDGVAFVYDKTLDPDGTLPALRAHFEEREELAYFRLGYQNTKDFPLWAGDLVSSEYFLEHLDNRTRLTLIENVDKIRPSTVLSLLFLNPCKDSLKRAKALCEGTEDPSWMGKIDAQAAALGPDQTDLARGTRYVGLMMCVMVTVLSFALIYGLVWLTTLG